MADRPITFTGPMVLALLDGRKTQTRRILKSARVAASPGQRAYTLTGKHLERALQNADRFRNIDGDAWSWQADAFEWQHPVARTNWLARVGYAVGGRLWVRESVGRQVASFFGIEATNGVEEAYYLADSASVLNEHGFNLCPWWEGKSLPAFLMPRWASRITLDVTAVKIERLQDISEEDAEAEGAVRVLSEAPAGMGDVTIFNHGQKMEPTCEGFVSAKDSYRHLWNSINGKRPGCGWAANPWVIAVSFRRVEG